MNENQAHLFLKEVAKKGDLLGLTTVKLLLAELGDPQDSLDVISVAGTNGKGSTCCFLSAILSEAGKRVGMFTSPEVFSYYDRFRIDNEPVDASPENRKLFLGALSDCEKAYRRLQDGGKPLPTIFEVEVAAAILTFLRAECDLAVFEAGMGGDLDATNVFSHQLAAVFTPIGIDHTDFLGNTPEEIAGHKAGLLHPGVPAFSAQQLPKVMEVLKKTAEENRTTLTVSGKEAPYPVGMKADYQKENAALAASVCRGIDPPVPEEAIQNGLQKAFWPGRMEKICETPPVFLDGAHNVPAMEALVSTLQGEPDLENGFVLVLGILKDKAYLKMLSVILPPASEVICVTPPSDRALFAEDLAKACRETSRIPVTVAESFSDAARLAFSKEGQTILCTGSFTILKPFADEIRRLSEENGREVRA